MGETRDFKFGTQPGFVNAHHKTTPRGKVGVALGYGTPIYLGFPFNTEQVKLAVRAVFNHKIEEITYQNPVKPGLITALENR